MSVTYAYAADITKAERDANGDLLVYGKATGPDLDLDQQICDPQWLKSAMPEWFEFGNVREMHQPIAAGVGVELTEGDDGWYLKSKAIDANTAAKIEAGALKGYSVGIKNPKVVKDATAPGGRIVGGTIVEVSYVDRPCNPTAKMAICKAAGTDGALQPVEAPEPAEAFIPRSAETAERAAEILAKAAGEVEPDAGKRDFSSDQRDRMADEGQAMPDGSFPIANVKDLRNAIRAVGRAKNPAAARRHIIRRARALGRSDLIPDEWKGIDPDTVKADEDGQTHDPAELAAVRDGLARLMQAELDELMDGESEVCDLEALLCSLRMFLSWWEHEAASGETTSPYTESETAPAGVMLAADPDTTKAAPAAPDTSGGTPPDLAELVKAAVAEAVAPSEERVKALEAELAKVKAQPLPGGPVLTRPVQDIQKAERSEGLLDKAAQYERMALEQRATDPNAAAGYLELAAQARREAAAR